MSAVAAASRRVPPVVLVLGATGAGKSKLALELAQKFGGEVISADAMQMYKGLDIVTNKVTREELAAVNHHVIDFLDPLEKCTVVDFRNKALPIVDDLLSRKVMPIVCGGTNYYIESLVWKILMDQTLTGGTKRAIDDTDDDESVEYESLSNEELLLKLAKVDPARSKEVHRNDRRKIVRSLQVFSQTGRRHSDLIAEQRLQESDDPDRQLGGPLRYENCLAIWVQCDLPVLYARCDKRVDKMAERGMLDELQGFHDEFNAQRGANPDYTVGIFQSIGFKEFHDYLTMSAEVKASDEGKKALASGVERMKVVTRQYARRQVNWMKNRFLTKWRQTPPVYAVDSKDPARWQETCYDPAVRILESVLSGKTPAQSPIALVEKPIPADMNKIFRCDVCHKDIKGAPQYEEHLAGKKHHVLAKKQKLLSSQFTVVVTGRMEESATVSAEILKIVKRHSTGIPLQDLKSRMENVFSAEGEEIPEVNLNLAVSEEVANNAVSELEALGIRAKSKALSDS